MKLSKPFALVTVGAALVVGLAGCSPSEVIDLIEGDGSKSSPESSEQAVPEFDAPEGSVADAIKNDLKTEDYDCQEKEAEDKYERCDGSYTGNRVKYYGQPWKDVDDNGCDTRNDILQRDLTDVEVDEDGCKVVAGVLDNPYSEDEQIIFQPGAVIQIDHVMPPGYGHYAGMMTEHTQEERVNFANDPENLVAAKGSDNNEKRDKLPDRWLPAADQWNEAAKTDAPTADDLPENTDIQCNYVSDMTYVALKYDLTLTQKSADAMLTVLSTCPDQKF